MKINSCPRGEIGRHKGLKILALLGVPVRVWNNEGTTNEQNYI